MNTKTKMTAHVMEVDDSIIKTLIHQQAGSIEKAILELVMNEIDAKATRVDINISDDLKRIEVSGDGHGFRNNDDIIKLFGDLGFDHSTEEEANRERRYGLFGLGRTQVFSFGACSWHTNEFIIKVNLEKTDASTPPYSVETYSKKVFDGCKVVVDLFSQMNVHDRQLLPYNITKMLKYSPVPIYMNDKLLTKDIKGTKWDYRDEHFGLELSPKGSGGPLRIYNDGVYVCSLSNSQYGVSGDLTTIDCRLILNIARNDIVRELCPLWPKLKEFIKPAADSISKSKSSALTEADRLFLLNEFIIGRKCYSEVQKFAIIPDFKNRYKTISDFLSFGQLTTTRTSTNIKAERLMSEKRAFVLGEHWVRWRRIHEVRSIESLHSQLSNAIYRDLESDIKVNVNEYSTLLAALEKSTIVDFDYLTKGMNSLIVYPDVKKAPAKRRAQLEALSVLNSIIFDFVDAGNERVIKLGKSEMSDSWTDGETFIGLKIDFVNSQFKKGLSGILVLCDRITQEYNYSESTIEQRDRNIELEKNEHDMRTSRHYQIIGWAENCLKVYFEALRKHKATLSSSEISKAAFGLHGEIEKLYLKMK